MVLKLSQYGNQITEKSEHKIKRDQDQLIIIRKKIFLRNILFSLSRKGGVIEIRAQNQSK